MAETLEVKETTWDNPKKLQYIHDVISGAVAARKNAMLIPDKDLRDVQRYTASNQVFELADKVGDPFLQAGIPTLFENWDEITEYLLTPPAVREPVTLHCTDINGSIGAACLAARFSGQEIKTNFNLERIDAAPSDTPLGLRGLWINKVNIQRRLGASADRVRMMSASMR